MSIVELLLKATVSFTASSCRKRMLPNVHMCAALINSLEGVWSKRTHATQLALACENGTSLKMKYT